MEPTDYRSGSAERGVDRLPSVDLLERDDFLGLLESCLADAARGAGRLVLVAGEAGIGKTSVARAFCAAHPDDAHVWWGACDALSTPRPLGPLYDLARAAGGDLAALMASDASRHDRFTGFLDALRSPLRPVIVVIEDAHWADDASRDLLIFVARRVGETNAVVVVTYRDDEVGAEHPLRVVLGQLATLEPVRRLDLPRLTVGAVADLAGQVADAEDLYRVTGGNPFFVTEVLAVGSDAVPATVADAVLARASLLSAPARAALEAAAIVPDRAEVALVGAIAGDTSGVDECAERGLLVTGRRSVRFRHELARLAVEQAIAPNRLPDMHAAALAYLAGRTDTDPARMAYHADQAGDRDAVLAHAPAAAEQAGRLGAHREAVAHYRRAVRHADHLSQLARAELLERYADECMAVDSELEGISVAESAIEIWTELGDVERAASVMARRAYMLWGTGRSEQARASAREAVRLVENRPASRALATAYTYAAHLHMLAREIPEAIELGERAVALAEQYDDDPQLARALNIVGTATLFVDPDRAEATLGRALDAAHRSGDDTIVGIIMRMLGSGSGELRRYATADHWLAEGVRWCAERDLDIHGDYCLAWSARTTFEQGRWFEASTVASQVGGRPTEHTPTRIVALTTLGRLRVRRGDSEAETPLDEAWELACRTGDLQRLWPVAAGRAEAAWLAGHLDSVPDMVEATYHLGVRLNHPFSVGELAFWLWRAGALESAPKGAYEPYRLQIDGDWRGAAQAWSHIGCPYEQAFALADSDDTNDLLRALEVLSALGARPLADRVAAQLRDLGVPDLPRRPTRATLDNPAGLTDRELEVLVLLGDGRTNSEIGAALHISPKTAGHHVSAILAKLDVHDRRAAVRIARERGISRPR